MTSAPTAQGFQPSDDAWRQVEALVQEVAQLSTSTIPVEAFYRSLLEKALQAMAATAGVVWLRDPADCWAMECQLGLENTPLGGAAARVEHLRLVDQAALSGAAQLIQPDAVGPWRNTLPLLLVMAPVMVDGAALAVLEILQRPGTTAGAQRGYLRFIATLSELAADFHGHRHASALRLHSAKLEQLDQFAQLVHGSLDPLLIGYVIANEGRRLIGCDRLSVLVRRSRHCELLAVSGVDQLDARSALSRQMTQLGDAVLRVQEPLWYGEGTVNLPPQLEEQIHAYLDQAHSRMVALVPLREQAWMEDADAFRDVDSAAALGVLVIERFESGVIEPSMQEAAAAVCRHSVPALRNAQEIESLPFAPLLRGLAKIRWIARMRQWPKWAAAAAAVAALLAVMAVIPADFSLESPGELQPERRREIFASSDGVVQQLNVAHGDKVEVDQVLITLQKPQLDFELSRVLGETQTARKRLAGIQAERLGPDASRAAASPEKANQLTAEEEEVKQLLASLDSQYAVLRAQQADLSLRSPIAGQVLTWNVADLLAARPVQRGQALLTVADLTGPWKIELRLPDDRAGYLLAAQRQATAPLEVTFVLASEPGVTQRGKVERVALAAESQTDAPAHVLVTVSIDSDKIDSPRPGATLMAKIHCGRRSLAFVWLHDVWNAIYSRLLF